MLKMHYYYYQKVLKGNKEREEVVSSDWLSTNEKVAYKQVVFYGNVTEMYDIGPFSLEIGRQLDSTAGRVLIGGYRKIE